MNATTRVIHGVYDSVGSARIAGPGGGGATAPDDGGGGG